MTPSHHHTHTHTHKYITHNVFLLEARSSGIAPGNQTDLLLLWQPTDTHNCAEIIAIRDAAAYSYTMAAEVQVKRSRYRPGVAQRVPGS